MATFKTYAFFGLLLLVSSNVVKSQGHDFKEVLKSQSEFLQLNSSAHFFSKDTFAFFGYSRFEDLGPLWFTTDQGATWRSKGYHYRSLLVLRDRSLLVMDLKTMLLLDDDNNLTISQDSGATFQTIALPFDSVVSDIKKIGPNVIVVEKGASFGEAFISTDTCKTYQKVTLPVALGEVVFEDEPYVIVTSLYPWIQGYMETFDYGITWRHRSYGQNHGQFHRYIDDSTIYAFNRDKKTLKWSKDRLATIQEKIDIDIDSNLYLVSIGFATRYIGYLIASDSMLYKTYDGGKTWSHKYTFEHRVNQIEFLGEKTVVFHNLQYYSENAVIYVTNNAAEELSIHNVLETSGPDVYPNPAQAEVKVEASSFKNGVITLRTLDGRVLYKSPFQEQQLLETSSLQNGLYILELTEGERSQRAMLNVMR